MAYSGLSTHHVFKEDILKELREIRTRERTHALFNHRLYIHVNGIGNAVQNVSSSSVGSSDKIACALPAGPGF